MRIDGPVAFDIQRPTLAPTTRAPGAAAVGQTAQPLTAAGGGATGFDPNDWVYFDQDDVASDPNACGTTTLAMILASRGLIPPTLAAAKEVDQAVRAWGGFSAPDDLEKFAESKGLHSEGYNDQSIGDLKKHLGAGRSVMAMVDGGGSPHWVAVQNIAADGKVTYADPATGTSKTVSQAEFEKMWANPMQSSGGFVNGLMNYKNFIQVMDSKPVPASNDFDIAYTQAAADGITNITNGWEDIKSVFTKGNIGGLATGLFGMAGGVISTASAIPGAIGRIIEMGGDKVLDWAKSEWNKPGIGHKILGGLGYVGGGILKGLGWVTKGVGNVVAKIGQGIGNVVTSIGKGIKKVGEAVVNGVKKVGEKIVDGVKSVGKAIASGIKKIFSGW